MMVTQGLLRRRRLLTERQETILRELRGTLQRLSGTLERLGPDVTPADEQALNDALSHLDELFLLVIVGEFNSGKSTFINALLGAPVQDEGVTPTTDRITLLRFGEEVQETMLETFLMERAYPGEVLKQLTIVDTPGTNAVVRRHEELTRSFIPRSDLVLFITSADRPFTETERSFMTLIKEWGKKVVIVINKIDFLETEEEVDEVVEFVRDNARTILGVKPDIFPVSSRMANRAREIENESVQKETRTASQFDAIERYVVKTLDEETRVRLKLLSPLGVAERLDRTYLQAVEQRLEVLKEDFKTLDNIDHQISIFRDDLTSDVKYHLTEIDAILRDLEERGVEFFEEHIRLNRIFDLMQGDKLKIAFEKEVIGDLDAQIDKRINALIDWSIDKNLRLWQSVTDYITRRRVPQHGESIIGQVGGAFDYNRDTMLETVGVAAMHIVASYDREKESEEMVEDVHAAISRTALTEVLAVGVGALLVTLFTTAILDITGVIFAALMATGGFLILPTRKRQAQREFRKRVGKIRDQLRQEVQRQFEKETDESMTRIREAIGPYTRFVRSKREQLGLIQTDLLQIAVDLERLRTQITK